MIIRVRVVPNSKAELLEKLGASHYKLKVRAKAQGGKANEAVIAALATHFGIAHGRVSILKGKASHDKTLEILGIEA